MVTFRQFGKLSFPAITFILLTGPTLAASGTTGATNGVAELEEVVVTARRREESMQSVPVAITAVKGERLEQLNVYQPTDLKKVVAGLNVTSSAGRASTPLYSLRGQRAADQVMTQDPPVAAYLDEVVISPLFGANLGLFDLESVQVLKGPQGTLFGRNTTGGAILYTSAKPTEKFSGKATVGYGKYNEIRAGGFINVPVNDKLRLRGAIDFRKNDGYGEIKAGPSAGQGAQDIDQIAGRVSMAFDPTEDIKTLTTVSYANFKSAGASFHILDTPSPTGAANVYFNTGYLHSLNPAYPDFTGVLDAAIAQQRSDGAFDTRSEAKVGAKTKVWSASNTITVDLTDTVKLKNIFGFRKVKAFDRNDFDGTTLPILLAVNGVDAKTWSEELQLQGSAFDERLDYILGLYFFRQSGIEGTGLPGLFDNDGGSIGNYFFGGAQTLQYSDVVNRSYSGFSQVGYKLTDKLKANVGVRFSSDKREVEYGLGTVSGTAGGTGANTPTVLSCGFTDSTGANLPATYDGCKVSHSASFSQPSWLVGLDYQLDPVTLLYIASRHSYRSGGFQSRPFDNTTAGQSFRPEKVTDVELGLKRDWDLGGDVGLRTNLATYYEFYKDIQRNFTTATPVGVGNIVQNAAKAHIFGVEVETQLSVGRFATLAINYAYTHPKYDKYITSATVNGVANQPDDYSDRPFQDIPEHSFNASLTVTPPIPDQIGKLSLLANVAYLSEVCQSEVYCSKENLAHLTAPSFVVPDNLYVKRPGYTLVGLRGQLDNIAYSQVSVAVWVDNLFDRRYVDSSVPFQDSIGFATGVYGAPRTYGAEVSYKF